ncbi:MAG: hypothetical protein GW779_05350 [Candidatus Altiarchaeum hamiconexum]|uniref:Uncharacterized protein n=1 Tax=Candidatus Altarchaeum hamiconexum TaxID=1803513 RepID=A0A8J7YVC3_9ARCH|nr:hypothetical protein [Candidatus Altarchaeum hamiconexum]NCN69260.1 hypothetical protein [Candidatus Altarchaeum hamiconexum]NCS91812.1 hypothetical protein [Candidatus Altarchaeum hamiconexum]NCT00710.1 hypothetical protein [Candidatus Altarchaeum hamiconexum]
MQILIIAEKPSVAERIASSFGNASKLMDGKASYFEINLKENHHDYARIFFKQA